jgi:hypothetical protein
MKKMKKNLFKLKILKIFQLSIGPKNNTVKLKLGSISPTFRTFWRKIVFFVCFLRKEYVLAPYPRISLPSP